MRIVIKWLDELKAEVKVENEEWIKGVLKAFGVVNPTHYLRAWIDYVTGDATVYQEEYLRSNDGAMSFLDSITVIEE